MASNNPKWSWWHQYEGPDQYRRRENLRAIWDLHSNYGDDVPWLWRGQANATYDLTPGMHTRIARAGTLTDDAVVAETERLLQVARHACLDIHEGVRLPDMALLARLQHHFAATPLLDVSLDPLVGLYMSTVDRDGVHSDQDGAVFAIKKPSHAISDFDSRSFRDVYESLPSAGGIAMYSAPDVSDRLRIQRGHFLLGRVDDTDDRVTIPLSIDRGKVQDSWIWARLGARGKKGPVPPASTDIAVFRTVGKFKPDLETWLENRSGLTRDFVYPTAWNQPHLDRFAQAHSRTAPATTSVQRPDSAEA
ncbi:hypothetical protein nbrc107696_08160 [Gordonia spumicola]|uniref:FRG domain-containing protein n=1 Tax=Gordonia spumicola TaxID=589161 RepID=A0A7I9V5N6_9ACTN|nr:FRG domain-containing protein [Gordonia spumicola]GEE00370.1 hypothetical protein nbrc107696_08160 [Gordonia spumicola]